MPYYQVIRLIFTRTVIEFIYVRLCIHIHTCIDKCMYVIYMHITSSSDQFFIHYLFLANLNPLSSNISAPCRQKLFLNTVSMFQDMISKKSGNGIVQIIGLLCFWALKSGRANPCTYLCRRFLHEHILLSSPI